MAYGPVVWGADTPVSEPATLIDPEYVKVEMGGFGFGRYGIAHRFTEVDQEAFMQPYWGPIPTSEAVPFDGG